jgi:alcohol dehydrogenase (cytochrome c)
LWGGEVATKVNFLEQGGMVWVFKIPKGAAAGDTTAAIDSDVKALNVGLKH